MRAVVNAAPAPLSALQTATDLTPAQGDTQDGTIP